MRAKTNIGSVTMPAGTYYVGDPCYTVPDERWEDWLKDCYAADPDTDPNLMKYLLADIDDRPVLGIGTAHGDGVYYDEDGNQYAVDAGLIGLVPVDIGVDKYGSAKVTFPTDFDCSYEDGVIELGHIRINTDEWSWE